MNEREQSTDEELGELKTIVGAPPAELLGNAPSSLGAETLFPRTNVNINIRPPFQLRPSYTGRQDVIQELQESFALAIDGSGLSFNVLVGDAGMGKSRTIRELADLISADKDSEVRMLVGACDASEKTYAGFAMLLAERFGILPADTDAQAQRKLERGISEVVSSSRVTECTHLIAHLMRRPFKDSHVVAPLAGSPQQLEMRTFLALKRFLAADAEAGALVLCFENLEQADAATINLLHFLVSGLASARIMVIGTATSELFDAFPLFGDVDIELRRYELSALSEAESESLFRQLCQDIADLPAQLPAHARKLGGSPRAIFELVRYLVEANVVVPATGGGWKIDRGQLARTPLPAQHADVVTARIDNMKGETREVLHRAAIIGETFWLDAIVALMRADNFASDDPDGPTLSDIASAGDATKTVVSRALQKLVSQEWLTVVEESSKPGEREYRFAYGHLWHLVYEGTSEGSRGNDHLRTAQWLELRPNGRLPVTQEDIGHHLELAGDIRGAARRFRRSADHARQRFLNDKAIRLYSRALQCLGQADQAERIHLWHDLGSVYELKGDYKAAIGAFERMLRLSWLCASRTKAAVAFNKMGRVWRKKGDLKLSLDYLNRGLQLFEQAGDERGIAGSLDDIGQVHYLLGDFEEAYKMVTAGLQRRGRSGDSRAIATSLSTLGNIQQDRGRIEEALNCHREALDLRQSIDDRAGVASSLNNLAVISWERGNVTQAREGWEKALKEAEAIGALPLQAHVLANLGEIALHENRFEEARRRLVEGVAIASEIADRRLEVEATRNMARLDHLQGRTQSAREHAHRAHTVASDAGLRDYEGRALLTLAEVFGGTLFDATDEETDGTEPDAPSLSKAESYFQQGIDVMRAIGNETELAKGLESYGRYKIEQGDVPMGRGLLSQCLEIYRRLGLRQTSDVERILASID